MMRFATILFALAAGCDRGPSASIARTSDESPLDVARRLIEFRRQRQYEQLYSCIIRAEQHHVVKFLMAVDEFIAANKRLCDYVRENISVALADAIDYAHLAGNLDLFSDHVELLDQRVEGEKATVTFLVDNALPARRTVMRREDGVWRYDPGRSDASVAAPAIMEMTKGVQTVLRMLNDGTLDAGAVKSRPDLLTDELRVRMLPGVRMLPSESSTSRPGD